MVRSGSKLTWTDFVAIPEDRKCHEIIDGEHCVNAAPTGRHQRVSGQLYFQLRAQMDPDSLGTVLYAPIRVQLSKHDIVQPDLLVVLTAHASIITKTRVAGAPDIVIEVLSRATRRHDRERKKAVYERTGVGEYWIVDPEARRLEQWVLKKGHYRLAGEHAKALRFTGPADIEVDLTKVW